MRRRIMTVEPRIKLALDAVAGDIALYDSKLDRIIIAGQRDAEMREMQNKIDALREANSLKDVIINNGQQTAVFSQMIQSATTPIANAVANLQGDVNGIKCKLPETVSVQWPNLTAVPTCFANLCGLAGLGYGSFGNWGCNNSLWG